MTFSRSWRFAPESAPTRCDSASRMRSSSSECARSPLVSALTPSTDRVAFDARCRSQSAGANRIWKRRIGGAVRRATRSVKRIAKDFGASSPTTMCRKVIVARASARSRGSETIRSGREPAARMLEERRPGRQAPVHDTRAGRVYAARGKKADNAAGGGRMRRGVAVGMGCALLFAGVVAAHARGDRELTKQELRAEMAENSALPVIVKGNAGREVAEPTSPPDGP